MSWLCLDLRQLSPSLALFTSKKKEGHTQEFLPPGAKPFPFVGNLFELVEKPTSFFDHAFPTLRLYNQFASKLINHSCSSSSTLSQRHSQNSWGNILQPARVQLALVTCNTKMEKSSQNMQFPFVCSQSFGCHSNRASRRVKVRQLDWWCWWKHDGWWGSGHWKSCFHKRAQSLVQDYLLHWFSWSEERECSLWPFDLKATEFYSRGKFSKQQGSCFKPNSCSCSYWSYRMHDRLWFFRFLDPEFFMSKTLANSI